MTGRVWTASSTSRPTLDATIADARPAHLEWDCNRDHVVAEHDGVAAAHAHALATCRLLDDLRAAHPGPGGRVLRQRRGAHRPRHPRPPDRVWASDADTPSVRA